MLGRVLGHQVWKKKPGNWPKVNKDLEELPYINDLTTSLLHSSLGGCPHPFSLGASLSCFCLNKLFLCVLSHLCCAMSLIINFVPVFTALASVRNVFFTGGKSQGVWWLGFLVFIQATQVQFLGREFRSRFTPPLTTASPRSRQEEFSR